MKIMRMLGILNVYLLSTTLWANQVPNQKNNDNAIYIDQFKQTQLYQNFAHDCRILDLEHWTHPSLGVFKKFHIKIEQVQLCNQGKYPIFIGESKYDLSSTPNQKYANDFFTALAKSNAYWSFAFVETLSQDIHYLDIQKKTLQIDHQYESYHKK